MGFDNNDYIDVAQRVNEFFRRYPEASIQCDPAAVQVIGDRAFISVIARAYRTPDDERPGIAQAWEPFPGKTNFTRDSEAMNAETSAIGRALAALGVETKRSMATKNDVERRRAEAAAAAGSGEAPAAAAKPKRSTSGNRNQNDPVDRESGTWRKLQAGLAEWQKANDASRADVLLLVAAIVDREVASTTELTMGEASAVIERLASDLDAS